MRETIAKRMQQSVVESPHFYLSSSIIMDDALRLRAELKEHEEYKGISVNHLVVKAVAYAASKEPKVNRAFRAPSHVFQPASINIGMITAVEDGLIIPVLHGVAEMTLQDVVFEARAVIERVRAGRPLSKDLSGGTISISNLGMFEVDSFTALISPGQGAVLAVSSTSEQAVVRNGQFAVAQVMNTTLAVDHRVIDGVMAANFMKHFKAGLECPALLMR
jgi:pyruvate dehydrogenase E2 component (dihydrolipoamide acetyltransferase)